MITKKVVRVRSPEEREEEAPPEAPQRIDDEPPMVAGRYLNRATGEPVSYEVPRSTLAKVAGEVRLDRKQVGLFLVGFAFMVVLVLALGYLVGRGETLQQVQESEAPPPAPAASAERYAGAPAAEAEASAAEEGAAPARDPLSFYSELAERKPESAVALLAESDPKKFLQDSAARSVVTPPADDPGDRGLFTIQVSSFEAEEGANRLLELLRKAEVPAYILPSSVEGKTWYRVRVGQYTSRSEAERAAKKVRDQQGLPAYVTPSQT